MADGHLENLERVAKEIVSMLRNTSLATVDQHERSVFRYLVSVYQGSLLLAVAIARQYSLDAAHEITLHIGPRDTDPEPQLLSFPTCRICYLMIERYRAIVSTIERDISLMCDKNIQDLVQSLTDDLDVHLVKSHHTPVVESVRGLLQAIKLRRECAANHGTIPAEPSR